MQVLLISPRLPAGDARRSGDHTYTDLMLQYPPDGVEYFHYEDLIAAGRARRIRSLQAMDYHLTRAGFLPPDMWFEAIETDFVPQIIHIYGFSAVVKLTRRHTKIPVILGAGTGSYSDLKYYHGWSEPAIRRARHLKRYYLRIVGAFDSSLHPERAHHVLTWSEFSRSMHLAEGYVHPERISVLYPGMPAAETVSTTRNDPKELSFLFVGRDFERKNGFMVLEAFRTVHAAFPATRLILVGQVRDGRTIQEDGVVHRPFIPREELLQSIYPNADVLILPSRAEGFGLVIVEAMARGLPCIAVNAWAMPEIIQDGANGLLIAPNSIDDLTERMLRVCAQPEFTVAMQQQAVRIFLQKFELGVHNRQLRDFYINALS